MGQFSLDECVVQLFSCIIEEKAALFGWTKSG